MMVKSYIKTGIMLVLTVMIFISLASVSRAADQEYSISGYDVTVRINTDGSADMTERIDFAFYGGFNNIMIPIVKNEGEEIEVQHIYIMRKKGFIECKKLLAGQWDAEVFTGTYSVLDEGAILKLKLYGTFSHSNGSVIVQYRVKNAVKRYQDVAEYSRVHILKSWETRISNINLYIYLPISVDMKDIMPFLHGVFVGSKTVNDQRTILYNVPDKVPGEYVEARILFPESVLADFPVTEDKPYLEEALAEEQEYQKSDKAELLAARESAARKAGQRAFNERFRQRAKMTFSVLSITLSILGLYLLMLIQRKIRLHKKMPLPSDFKSIKQLTPAEVRMLLSNGQTGARALLGNLMTLVSKGLLSLELPEGQIKPSFALRLVKNKNSDDLSPVDQYLMGWIAGMASEKGLIEPEMLKNNTRTIQKAHGLKLIYDQWDSRVREAYNDKDMLDDGIVRYRNLGIIAGSLLSFLGCIVPITLSIAAGFLMLPVGIILLLYSLRIRKHTDFGIEQHRIWKTIRTRIRQNNLALDSLPEWMKPYETLIGFSIVLRTEKEMIQLVTNQKTLHPQDCHCAICALDAVVKNISEELTLERVLKNTCQVFNEAISSVQDAD